MADAESLPLPLSCPLVINGEEGKASSGRKFSRENPADFRQVATVAEEGTKEDARAAIDAARVAFDGNADNWLYNYKLREQVLQGTAQLIRATADRLAKVVSLEVGMPMRQAVPHVAADHEVKGRGREAKLLGVALLEADRGGTHRCLAPRLGDHRGREVDAGHAMAARQELEAEEPGAAADVERLQRPPAGEHEVEDTVPGGALGRRADAVAEIVVEARGAPVPVRRNLLLDHVGHGHFIPDLTILRAGPMVRPQAPPGE